MKKILLYLSAILLASCLNVEPETEITSDGVVKDESSAEAALVGAYDSAETFEGRITVTMNYASDNVVLFNAQADVVPQFTAAGPAGFDPTGGGGYSNYYAGINKCNTLIAKLPDIDEGKFSAGSKNRILAEAYFLRALAYFDLARTYSGVPLVLQPSESKDGANGIVKSSYNSVLQQVEDDLNAAQALFTDALPTRARASVWSVYALKARLYLYQKNYTEAENYASKVIEKTSLFELTDEPQEYFNTRLTSEAIFELVFDASDSNPFYTYYLPSGMGGRFDYMPAPELIQQLLDTELGGKRSQLIADRGTGDGVYYITEFAKQDGSSSIHVLRLAEQYLIRAEARTLKASPDLTGAAEDINAIRSRAGLADTDAATIAELQQVIENERRYELAFDGHRFNDIVRTGRAAEVFGTLNPALANPDYWVLPFPYTAILADPDLQQNEGY